MFNDGASGWHGKGLKLSPQHHQLRQGSKGHENLPLPETLAKCCPSQKTILTLMDQGSESEQGYFPAMDHSSINGEGTEAVTSASVESSYSYLKCKRDYTCST